MVWVYSIFRVFKFYEDIISFSFNTEYFALLSSNALVLVFILSLVLILFFLCLSRYSNIVISGAWIHLFTLVWDMCGYVLRKTYFNALMVVVLAGDIRALCIAFVNC